MHLTRSITAIVGAAAALTLTLAGCSSGPSTTAPEPGTGGEVSAQAQAALDRAYEGIGSTLSDLTPVKTDKQLNVFVVSCGEQVTSCSEPAASAKAAAEVVGWKATIADGKLNPEGFATAIRQGVAAGADVIIPIGIGCGVAQAAFKEAKDAGITVIGGGNVDDCQPKLWASERLWLPDYNPVQQWEAFGQLQADYAFGKLEGNVKAVVLNFTTQVFGQWITDGFTKELDTLGGGSVVQTIDISDPEMADGSFVQKVTTALLSQADANVLVVPIDAWLTNGLAASLKQAGLTDRLLVISRGGDGPALDLIRQGGQGLDATIGFAVEWGAWGSVDTAMRVLAGEKPLYIGESMQAIDKDHNMPASGGYKGSVDFKTLFKKAWGV